MSYYSHRLSAGARLLYIGALTALGALGLVALAGLGGCENFKPLSLDWPWHRSPTSQPDTLAKSAPQPAPEVASSEEDLARRVREYADNLDKAAKQQKPQSPRLIRQPGTGVAFPDPNEASAAPTVTAKPAASATKAADVVGSPVVQPHANSQSPVDDSRVVVSAEPPAAAPAAAASDANKTSPRVIAPAEAAPPILLASFPMAGVMPANKAATAGQAVTASADARPEQSLADAIANAERAAASAPADFRTQFQLRLLYLAAGRSREARAAWSSGSASDQQLLGAWVEAAAAMSTAPSPSDPVGDHALGAVDRLRYQLAERAALKVRTVKFASRVDGFGVVAPFPGEVYHSGQWVVVYSELENLTSRSAEDGQFRTELSLRVEVLSSEGKSLLSQEDAQVVDRSLSQRRDFFVARRLRLPEKMEAGQYVLRVSVEDRQAAKVGESMLKFQVR